MMVHASLAPIAGRYGEYPIAHYLPVHRYLATLPPQPSTCRLLSALMVGAVLSGCGAVPTQYPAGYKEKFEKKHGGDEAKARNFVNTLQGIPQAQRKEYVQSHWADSKNLSLIPDQELQKRYRDLVQAHD